MPVWSKRAKITLPPEVASVCQEFREKGYRVYVVGGAVRDALMGKEAVDWDLTTNALPEEVARLFPQGKTTGERFGTISLRRGPYQIEITTMRKERGHTDRRHPDEVVFTGSIEEDLSRRDFTVNAIAYDPVAKSFVDPFRGLRDLRRRILRCVGEPTARFQEDALRMARLYRFAATLQFRIDPASHTAVQPALIRDISAERVQTEMSKILLSEKPSLGLLPMFESGLLAEIIPELTAGIGVSQGSFHRFDVFHHCVYTADASRRDLTMRWAGLLHDVGKPLTRCENEKGIHFYGHDEMGEKMAAEILSRLRYPGKVVCQVRHLVRWHMFSAHAGSSDKALRKLIARVGRENIMNLLDLRRADIVGMGADYEKAWPAWKELHDRIASLLTAPLGQTDLAVDGHDVMEILGLRPGPQVGQALDWLVMRVLDEPELNDRSVLIRLLQEEYH